MSPCNATSLAKATQQAQGASLAKAPWQVQAGTLHMKGAPLEGLKHMLEGEVLLPSANFDLRESLTRSFR